MGQARGFSLIELIIVIAILGIVATISVPQYQRYRDNANLKTAAREVAADIFATRQNAVSESFDSYRLTFNAGSNSYSLSRTDTGEVIWTKTLASFGNGLAFGSVNFSGGSVVSFQRRGTVSMGSLTITNAIGSTATITVNITGRTYVQFAMQ